MVVNVYEAKTNLSKLLERVASGEEVILGKSGKPMARLVPYREDKGSRVPGRLSGQINILENFDETPAWLIDEFEGKE